MFRKSAKVSISSGLFVPGANKPKLSGKEMIFDVELEPENDSEAHTVSEKLDTDSVFLTGNSTNGETCAQEQNLNSVEESSETQAKNAKPKPIMVSEVDDAISFANQIEKGWDPIFSSQTIWQMGQNLSKFFRN